MSEQRYEAVTVWRLKALTVAGNAFHTGFTLAVSDESAAEAHKHAGEIIDALTEGEPGGLWLERLYGGWVNAAHIIALIPFAIQERRPVT